MKNNNTKKYNYSVLMYWYTRYIFKKKKILKYCILSSIIILNIIIRIIIIFFCFCEIFDFSLFRRETKLNGHQNPFCPQRLLCARRLPFAGLWSSISWLGELQLWYLTGRQITAPLKALWEWPIVHLWDKAHRRKKNSIVIVHIHWN